MVEIILSEDTGITHGAPISRKLRPATLPGSNTLPCPSSDTSSTWLRAIQAMCSLEWIPDGRLVEAQIEVLGKDVSLAERPSHHERGRPRSESNRCIDVLQTPAFPLRH